LSQTIIISLLPASALKRARCALVDDVTFISIGGMPIKWQIRQIGFKIFQDKI